VTVRRFAIVVILAVSLGGPVLELFDTWDQTVQDGNDTEADLVIVALCAGFALCAAGLVVARMRATSSTPHVHTRVSVLVRFAVAAFATPIPTSSPPTPIRV
jgi:hypothetical protein